tara:strand:+ start:1154 stop:1270 length:117 start_codon:yes stop_codon:yes gene_type:complete
MNATHIIPMFIEITAGTVVITSIAVVMMKMMMGENFEG